MARNEIYTIYPKKNGDNPNRCEYVCQKLDRDFEMNGFYTLTRLEYSCMEGIKVQVTCDCYAGTKETCRHRQMLDLFEKEGMTGSGRCYEYDRRRWYELRTVDVE